MMAPMSPDYPDTTLKATLEATGAPRILTKNAAGEAVYVALDAEGELVEVEVD